MIGHENSVKVQNFIHKKFANISQRIQIEKRRLDIPFLPIIWYSFFNFKNQIPFITVKFTLLFDICSDGQYCFISFCVCVGFSFSLLLLDTKTSNRMNMRKTLWKWSWWYKVTFGLITS